MTMDNRTALPTETLEKPGTRRRWLWGVCLVAAAAGATYLGRDKLPFFSLTAPVPAPAAAPAPIPVTAVKAVVRDLPITRSGLGTVAPLNQVDVKARVEGQLQTIAFTEGQYVEVGQVLAQIDPRPYQAQLAQAEAALRKDTAQLSNARIEENRTARLSAIGAGTSQAADNAKAQVAVSQALVQGDQAAVDTAKLNLGFTAITAPVAGRVGLKQVNAGAILRAGDATGIVTVTQIRPIAVQFSLPQDELPNLLTGQAAGGLSVSVDTRDGTRHLAEGKLSAVDSQVDPATGTVKLKAEFDNRNDALWPGALVAARVVVRTVPQAVVVPALAVQNGQKGPYVYIVKPDGTVTSLPVRVGPTAGNMTAIEAGVAPGDTVVLSGQSRLRQGTRVTVTQADDAPQSVAAGSQ